VRSVGRRDWSPPRWPNPATKTAAAQVRQAEAAAQAARDAALLQLRSPAPGQAAYLTNQVINALAAPVEAAWRRLDEAEQAAAAIPARVPLGTPMAYTPASWTVDLSLPSCSAAVVKRSLRSERAAP
jgi:hypothetical protein